MPPDELPRLPSSHFPLLNPLLNPLLKELPMNFQKLFEKSENTAVAVIFALFLVTHFGMLYLLGAT